MGTVEKLPQFTGRNGAGPPFAEWWMRLQATLREKDLHSACRVIEQHEDVIRPIAKGATSTNLKEAYTKDRQLSSILLNAITLDAFEFAQIKFPINEKTKDDDFIGLRLYTGLKIKYDIPLIRSEIFRLKQEMFKLPCNNGVNAYLAKITKNRFELLAHVRFSEDQITLLDEDLTQAIPYWQNYLQNSTRFVKTFGQ